jgi:3-deoxy-7-phosphoheptulonate synthase
MIIEIEELLSEPDRQRLCRSLAEHPDVTAWYTQVHRRHFIVVSGDEALVPSVDDAGILGTHSTERGYWLVDRANGVLPRIVTVGSKTVGGDSLWCAAGPCALESIDDAVKIGQVLKRQRVNAFRVGVFKPRTSPYNFQGKERAGIGLLADLRTEIGLPLVTEVLDPRDVEAMAEVADCLQVGTRNMTNQALLKELGRAGRPVLLKRGAHAPLVEWLRAAEFIAAHGNPDIILCARGIYSFDDSLRFMPDLGVLLAVRRYTDLPVIFDPSHSAGRRDAVANVALAAAAFGADGLLVESHTNPSATYRPGDGAQAYPPEDMQELVAACERVKAEAIKLDQQPDLVA